MLPQVSARIAKNIQEQLNLGEVASTYMENTSGVKECYAFFYEKASFEEVQADQKYGDLWVKDKEAKEWKKVVPVPEAPLHVSPQRPIALEIETQNLGGGSIQSAPPTPATLSSFFDYNDNLSLAPHGNNVSVVNSTLKTEQPIADAVSQENNPRGVRL